MDWQMAANQLKTEFGAALDALTPGMVSTLESVIADPEAEYATALLDGPPDAACDHSEDLVPRVRGGDGGDDADADNLAAPAAPAAEGADTSGAVEREAGPRPPKTRRGTRGGRRRG